MQRKNRMSHEPCECRVFCWVSIRVKREGAVPKISAKLNMIGLYLARRPPATLCGWPLTNVYARHRRAFVFGEAIIMAALEAKEILNNDILEFHEIANIFPLMDGDEYQQLVDDIRENGLIEPIWTYQGKIIDGRNRYRACLEAGVKTRYQEWSGKGSLVAFIVGLNLNRRHLTSSQKAVVALEILPWLEKEASERQVKLAGTRPSKDLTQKVGEGKHIGEATEQAAKITGTNRQYVADMKPVKELTPEVFEKVKAGKINVPDAKQIASMPIETRQEIFAKIETGAKSAKDAIKEAKIDLRKKDIAEKSAAYIPQDNIVVYHADVFDAISNILDSSIDLLNTDPPYNVLPDHWDVFESKQAYLDFTEKWLQAVMPKVKNTGRVYISIAPDFKYDFYAILHKNNFFGFNMGNEIIWVKRNNNKLFSQKRYRLTYEPIFYLYGNDAGTLNFAPDAFGEMQTDVWEIATPQSNFKEGKCHPAQKPLDLYKRIVETGSKVGDMVLDCFAGSGTTGIVCNELKRRCILIERDAENISIIRGRLVHDDEKIEQMA